jgi:FkbM family methyltransferase
MITYLRKIKRKYQEQFNWIASMFYSNDDMLMIVRNSIDYIVVDEMKYCFNNCSEGIIRQDDKQITSLTKEDTVLDIGANIGDWTILMAKKAKWVYAVEPLYYRELQGNISINSIKNITIYSSAISKFDGIELNVSFHNKSSLAPTITLKTLLNKFNKIDFLRCDCEGGEWCINPEDCKDIREMRFEFHIRRQYLKRDREMFMKWLNWFTKNNYQVTIDKSKLRSTVDFKEMWNVSASRVGR